MPLQDSNQKIIPNTIALQTLQSNTSRTPNSTLRAFAMYVNVIEHITIITDMHLRYLGIYVYLNYLFLPFPNFQSSNIDTLLNVVKGRYKYTRDIHLARMMFY